MVAVAVVAALILGYAVLVDRRPFPNAVALIGSDAPVDPEIPLGEVGVGVGVVEEVERVVTVKSRHDFVVRPTGGNFFIEEIRVATAARHDLGVVAVREVEGEIGAVEPRRTRFGGVPKRCSVRRSEPGWLRWHPCFEDSVGQVEARPDVDVVGLARGKLDATVDACVSLNREQNDVKFCQVGSQCVLDERRHVERRSSGAVNPLRWIERDIKIPSRVPSRGCPCGRVPSRISVNRGFRPGGGGLADGYERVLIHVHSVEFETGVHHLIGARKGQTTEIHVDEGHGSKVWVAGGNLTSTNKEARRSATVGVDGTGVKVGVLSDAWVGKRRDGRALLNGKGRVGAVHLFTDVVGEVEDRRSTSRPEHPVVEGLNHPAYFLCERQIGRRGEGKVGRVKSRRCGARVVGVQAGHVVARIGLNEDAPIGRCGRSAVRPREGRGAIGLERMRSGVPNDGGVGRARVDTAHGWRGDRPVFPHEGQVRSF